MGLKLLHISDIHFRYYENGQAHDLDKFIQAELEHDLERLMQEVGKIDIVIIGGDIAFSGLKQEYDDADVWIKKICEITGCMPENVLMVPGNHDINRKALSPIVQAAHDSLRACQSREAIDESLHKYLTDPESARLLLSPLLNYFEFAQKYGAVPADETSLYWEKDFSLDQSILRIRGVNSAVISDKNDHQTNAKLILGSHQTTLIRNKGVIYLVVCHHPPSWLSDQTGVEVDLKAGAKLQLFGHMHMHDTEVRDQSLIISAGSMQPDRGTPGWEPRYNVLDLSIPVVPVSAEICLNLYKRKWSSTSKKFIADFGDHESKYQSIRLPLSESEKATPVSQLPAHAEKIKNAEKVEKVIDVNNNDPLRKLAFLFLGLPYHKKIKIAVNLNLIEDSDSSLDEIRRAKLYLKRVTERKQLAELWDAVNEQIKEEDRSANPFKKAI